MYADCLQEGETGFYPLNGSWMAGPAAIPDEGIRFVDGVVLNLPYVLTEHIVVEYRLD